jgi:hypothetical protein
LAGSGLVEPGVELLGELVLPLAAPDLGEAALAPPDAEPGFAASLEAEPGFAASLEAGALELDEAPLDGDEDGVLGEAAGVDEVLLVSPRSHAARPRASATATARV